MKVSESKKQKSSKTTKKKTKKPNRNTRRRHFSMATPQKWEHHYLGLDSRYLRGNTDSKHRRQVIQGKGTLGSPAHRNPTRTCMFNKKVSLFKCSKKNTSAKTNEFSIAIYAIYKKAIFSHDKTALPKGYHYLKKITLGSRKMKRNWLWKKKLRTHLSFFEASLPKGTTKLLYVKIYFWHWSLLVGFLENI